MSRTLLAQLLEPPALIFFALTAAKAVFENWAARQQHHGGLETSRVLSRIFLVLGFAAPVAILVELLLTTHTLALAWCLTFAAIELLLMAARASAIRSLGRHYSVDLRIAPGHELVRTGLYRYVRHPIYLIALLEAFVYPLAAGAWLAAIAMTVLETPAVLWRWRQEEATLRRHFGPAHDAFRRATWL